MYLSHASSLSAELAIAMKAAALGGEVFREGYFKGNDVREKGVGDLVSWVDEKSDKVITEHLCSKSPAYHIISEELNPDASSAEGKT